MIKHALFVRLVAKPRKEPDGNAWLVQEVTTRRPGRI
jgi:hypothetical protein